jgi:3-oxoacyl-[acyl-carrier protein] reductase/(S)-1-phenylethanol dehydrogenase
MSSANRVAIITGGAGGIGAACAWRLAADGFDIGIVDIKPADQILAELQAAGRQAKTLACDITDPDSVGTVQDFVRNRFGRCDVLINNAGFYSFIPFNDLTFETWRRYMSVNLDGAFLMCKALVPLMQERKWGRIISLASNSFFSNVPGLMAYISTKGGLIGLTRGLASDLGGDGITANAVAPGPIGTEQVMSGFARTDGTVDQSAFAGFCDMILGTQALKRFGQPAEVADVVSFFASEQSRFITGQTLIIDGGAVRL